jgi:hypothetical protein
MNPEVLAWRGSANGHAAVAAASCWPCCCCAASPMRVRPCGARWPWWPVGLLLAVAATLACARRPPGPALGLDRPLLLGRGPDPPGRLALFRVGLLAALHRAAAHPGRPGGGGRLPVLWLLVTLSLAGVDLTSLVATSAVITAVLAFAMQDTLGNLLGGLALQIDDSLEIGDWVRIDDQTGQVMQIQWRFTALRTRNGEKVVIPNAQLMKSRFVVIGRRGDGGLGQRRWIGSTSMCRSSRRG